MKMTSYIKRLIEQGEHQQQDFKFEISDSKKIARSLVAFANTDGGKLLIGVKDNRAIAGVRSEEEYFMIEAAAEMYSKPPIPFKTTKWKIDGKEVMEIDISKSDIGPHKAPDSDGKWLVYIRVDDKNLLANKILLRVWELQKKKRASFIKYTEKEEFLLKYLSENENITLNKFIKLAQIPRKKAEGILVNLILMDVVEIEFTEKETFYRLKNLS
jgi:predicted HTH transcriptional regulator